ncbi:hypothetical protein FHR36_007748 [Kitasatospora paracochleata]|uniref:Uncharacterized protein n=1 Tax=Kitasatospora paracochleata TaxID=58354 RepID=A0ABT1JAR6_9ACTN|nr:hypothetical protein [Kitasatospora paracochleata]
MTDRVRSPPAVRPPGRERTRAGARWSVLLVTGGRAEDTVA